MTTDERLMFHLMNGYLRRWSLWNETTLPVWAAGEDVKHRIFQSWKHNPQKVIGKNDDGTPQYQFHPMAEFENWPYWLIIDLCRYVFRHEHFTDLMKEPENLKESVCDFCDERFKENEKQSLSQAMQ
jgi:hypothetical protein